MSIIDASGNLLSLLGSAYLFVKTQVLGRNKIKKLEVAVMKGSSSDREILLSLKTLIDWNLVHSDFPNVQLDSFIKKMVNKHMGKKAYSTLYLQQTSQDISQQNTKVNKLQNNHIKVRKQEEEVTLTKQNLECQHLQSKLMGKFKECFAEKLTPKDRIKCPDVRIILDPNKNVTPKAQTSSV